MDRRQPGPARFKRVVATGGAVPVEQEHARREGLRTRSGRRAGLGRVRPVPRQWRRGGDRRAPIVLDDSVGAAGTAIVEWPFTGGRYKVAVQYGTGAASNFRSVRTTPVGRTFEPGEHVRIDELWQCRLVNDLLVEQRGPWQLQATAVYQELDNGAASNNRIRWVSLGARPVLRLGRFFSLATEAGWDYTEAVGSAGGDRCSS